MTNLNSTKNEKCYSSGQELDSAYRGQCGHPGGFILLKPLS